jgi:hypothetical protein
MEAAMTTAQVTLTTTEEQSAHHAGVIRLAATLGATSLLIFVLCWLGTFIGSATLVHAYIGLFTTAGPQSVQALAEGAFWSLLFGIVSGGIIATFYNLFAGLDRL